MERTYYAEINQTKEDVRVKIITDNREHHSIMMKRSIHQKAVTVLYVYAPSNRTGNMESKS